MEIKIPYGKTFQTLSIEEGFEVGFLLFECLQSVSCFSQKPCILIAFSLERSLHFVGDGRFGRCTVFFELLQILLEGLQEFFSVLLFKLLALNVEQNRFSLFVLSESGNSQKRKYHTHYFCKHG